MQYIHEHIIAKNSFAETNNILFSVPVEWKKKNLNNILTANELLNSNLVYADHLVDRY